MSGETAAPPRTDRLAMAVPLALHRDIEIEFSAPPACVIPLHMESLGAMIDHLATIASARLFSSLNARRQL